MIFTFVNWHSPPLNLRVQKRKTTLWSNWAWPWSRQSCFILCNIKCRTNALETINLSSSISFSQAWAWWYSIIKSSATTAAFHKIRFITIFLWPYCNTILPFSISVVSFFYKTWQISYVKSSSSIWTFHNIKFLMKDKGEEKFCFPVSFLGLLGAWYWMGSTMFLESESRQAEFFCIFPYKNFCTFFHKRNLKI